jgi:hypothetical protein
MPTDLDAAVSARKRAEKAETQTLITIVLVWVIICLGMFGCCLQSFGAWTGSAWLRQDRALDF